jgi:hypothetical protein
VLVAAPGPGLRRHLEQLAHQGLGVDDDGVGVVDGLLPQLLPPGVDLGRQCHVGHLLAVGRVAGLREQHPRPVHLHHDQIVRHHHHLLNQIP